MSITWGPGMHAPSGRRVDASAYAQYIGRWSRLFVAALLPEPSRRAVRAAVRTRLAPLESNGRLAMSAEMLIASGRA